MKMKPNIFADPLSCLCLITSLAALSTAQAASISIYGVGKTQTYEQTSDTAVNPASPSYQFDAFAVPTTANSVFGASLSGPSGQPVFLLPNEAGDFLSYTESFDTQAKLDAAYGPGTYGLSLLDLSGQGTPINLTLGSDVFPTATPQITGFAALQAVDATKPLTLNWNSFAGATAGDFEQLVVMDDSGTTVYKTGLPGQANALTASAQSATIPANTLSAGSTYTATLTFAHLASSDATALPGALGVTTFAKQTSFNITATGGSSGGGGGGIPTGTPPFLEITTPFNNAVNVSVTSPVTFTFTSAMAPAQKITWSPNVDSASFTYSWSADAKVLTALHSTAFPANATITWALDPATFKDQSGTPLSTIIPISGSFKTASGSGSTNNPCNGGTSNNGQGSLSVFKSFSYTQTSAAAPVLSSDHGAIFEATILSPATNPVVSATMTLPGGAGTKPLTNIFGNLFGVSAEFSTQEAMDQAFPNGVYSFTINRTSGTANVSLTLGASGYPPTPQIQNFTAAQTFDRTADFTIQWLPYTGAAANDGISINLSDLNGVDFHAPDPCIPRPLKNTDVSIVIPKNTFSGSGKLNGSLSFSRFMSFDTNSIPGIPAFAGVLKDTSFELGGSAPATQPKLGSVAVMPDGSVHFQVTASPTATLVVEASNDLKSWAPIPAGAGLNGVFAVSDPGAIGQPHRFYRATAQ